MRHIMKQDADIRTRLPALLIAGATSVLAASSEADFKAAYAAAEAANKEAGALRNQWTTTAAALAAAKKAADKRRFRHTRSRRRRKPKLWPRLRSSRPPAKKKPGRQPKYAEHDPEKREAFSEKIMLKRKDGALLRRGDIA